MNAMAREEGGRRILRCAHPKESRRQLAGKTGELRLLCRRGCCSLDCPSANCTGRPRQERAGEREPLAFGGEFSCLTMQDDGTSLGGSSLRMAPLPARRQQICRVRAWQNDVWASGPAARVSLVWRALGRLSESETCCLWLALPHRSRQEPG